MINLDAVHETLKLRPTIPFSCGECYPSIYFETIEEMVGHIRALHPNYDAKEAEIYAQIWLEDAYVQDEERAAEYIKNYKEPRDY